MRRFFFPMLVVLTALVAMLGVMTPHAFSQSYITTSTNQIYSNQFTVSGYSKGESITCFFQDVQLQQGLAGTELFGTVSVSSPINFYILSNSELNGYLGATSGGRGIGGICDKLRPPSSHLSYYVTNSYSYMMHWTVPDSDNYYFVFANPLPSDAYVSFSYGSEQVVTVTPQEYTTPTYPAYTTPTFATSIEQLSSPTGNQLTNLVILLWVTAGVVAAVVLVYLYRSRGRGKVRQTKLDSILTQKSRKNTKPPTLAPGMMFCRQCGVQIPRDSKFCKECGAKIS